jgi:SAM-dependent methyltransferase
MAASWQKQRAVAGWHTIIAHPLLDTAMADDKIRFEDGAGYERMMGRWSQLAGNVFLDWLAPPPALRWLDVGCGNGAFTELLVQRCAPAEVHGIDPSDAQIQFAQGRPAAKAAQFRIGDAQALPFDAGRFDAAVMALVIFFVPDPVQGVAEMVRVVRPGGWVATYAWDVLGGGFPLAPLLEELKALGSAPTLPPSVDASRMEALRQLWADAGLQGIETRSITVERSFDDFEDYWSTSLLSASTGAKIRSLPPVDVAALRERVRGRLTADATGRITCSARANAIHGRVPDA